MARGAVLASKILLRLHGRRYKLEPVLEALFEFIEIEPEAWEAADLSNGYPTGTWSRASFGSHYPAASRFSMSGAISSASQTFRFHQTIAVH